VECDKSSGRVGIGRIGFIAGGVFQVALFLNELLALFPSRILQLALLLRHGLLARLGRIFDIAPLGVEALGGILLRLMEIFRRISHRLLASSQRQTH
jgi:hypothetical protein